MSDELKVLLRFLSDSSQAKADSASLRQQVGADLNAITAQSKVGSAEVAKAAQVAATSSTQAVAVTTREVNNTGLAFAQTARLASSAGRGIENVFAGNALAAMRNFSIASRTAFNPNGPLAFASGVNAVSQATKESEVLVSAFSSVLGSAAKNAEGALNKTLFKDFGITAEKALLNPSLAAQKFVSSLAEVRSAEDRAATVAGVFGTQSSKVLPIIEAQIAAQGQQVAALSAVQAAEERVIAARAALAAETVAATGAITGDVLATEGLAVAEAEATAAAQALTAAEAELAAVQGEVAVSSGLSAGAIGLVVIAVAALVYGIYKWLTAEKEVIIVSKEQITATQRRVELARQELESVERLSVATDGERQKREALIATKKEELQLSLNLQKAQEYAVVVALSNALQNEAQNRKKLIEAEQLQQGNWLTEGPALISREAIILKINEALGKSQEETKKAAQAADILSAATGRSKEQLFASALAHAKETDATGKTHNAYIDLVHALGLVTDAQGNLVPATDATTLALRKQIGALADLTTEADRANKALDRIAQARDTRIEGRIKTIVAIARGNIQTAREMAQRSVKEPGVGDDIKEQRGDEATRKVVEDIFSPPTGRKGGAKQDPRIKALEEQLKEAERVYKDDSEKLKRKYEQDRLNLASYVEEVKALEKKRYEDKRDALNKELALAKPADRKAIEDRLLDAERERDSNIQKAKEDAAKKEADALRKHLDDLEKIAQEYDKKAVDTIRARESLRVISHEDAENKIAAIEERAADRRYDALQRERERIIKAAGGDPAKANQEKLREIDAALKLLEAQEHRVRISFTDFEGKPLEEDKTPLGTNVLARQRRIVEAHQKDIEEEKKYQDEIDALLKRYHDNRLAEDRRMYQATLNNPYSPLKLKRFAIAEIARMDLDEIDARRLHNIAVLDQEEAQAKKELGAVADKERKKLELEKHYQDLRKQENERASNERRERTNQADEDSTFLGTGGNPFSALVGQITDNAEIIKGAGQMISSTFDSIGQAAGNAVKAFILFGSVGGSFRKFAAETIASIAQMAVVQAIFEGAQALAMYGLFYFTGTASFLKSAIAHGQAAAAFAIVGATATAIGRATAGSAFAQDRQGQGGGAGSGGSPTAYAAFNYNSSAPSASQANSEGSRTGNVIANAIRESHAMVATAINNNTAAIHYNSKVMAGIESYPPGDLIRQNPYPVADSLREALHSSHEVSRDIQSLATSGTLSQGSSWHR